MVTNWIDIVENELDLENSESEDESSIENFIDNGDITLANISNLPHPATDKNAKWKLQDIFIENLSAPSYLENFINIEPMAELVVEPMVEPKLNHGSVRLKGPTGDF
ncbi:10174_t:CDS:2 [Diversispora eburnea]|uniref:10174_t:CDS:1 n=1 Tax=Diversispora eburnea TaxID=1213867 RepID=A0A9N8WIR7_9GLOM|nr:10174_t:CDS:2 [Diversispora eburnea]